MTDLGTLDGVSGDALGINSSGQVVGGSYMASYGDYRAFLYSNGAMIDLNTLIAANSGWLLQQARAINDQGQIVGYGVNAIGQTDAFLLTPNTATTPVPVSTPIWLFGFILARFGLFVRLKAA